MSSVQVDLNEVESIYHTLKELHITRRCCRHRNILGCKSIVQDQKLLVCFESAKPLNSFSLFHNNCKEEHVSYVIKGILEALYCIHGHGKRLHGNINRATVFLDKDCTVKLGFPAQINNPGLVNTRTRDMDSYTKKIDFDMVGVLACNLYGGETREEELGWGDFTKKFNALPILLQDFVQLCMESSSAPTISTLMGHTLFKVYNKSDRCREELKKILKK